MNDEKTINLKDRNQEPVEEVVEIIEILLDKAERGELRSIVVAGELRGGDFYTNVFVHDRLTHVGLLECMKARAMAVGTHLFTS